MGNPLSQFRRVNISIKLTILLLALSALLPNAHSAAQTAAYLLTIQNSSDYTIEQIYIAPSDRGYWGANELGSILRPGALFRTRITGPGTYDFKFVNDNGNVCVLRNVGINRDMAFELTNEWLLDCESRRQ